MDNFDPNKENIAATLARVLPTAELIVTPLDDDGVHHIAVPKGFDLKELDGEKYLPNPRRTKATAAFSDPTSFLDYVKRHAIDGSTVWCTFNPQTFDLSFNAVIDEHAKDLPGWRAHRAGFNPDFSAEWKAWKGKDTQTFAQVPFAEWIEAHADDITTANGLPTSLQMLTMATEFVAHEEHVLKSTARLESGGVRLTYIADPDSGTTETMNLFKLFALGIPVFHGGAAWSLTARLKYRLNAGKVSFFYELVRPDRVHQGAALELIATIKAGLGDVPLLMGSCS